MARILVIWDSRLVAVGRTARTLSKDDDLARGHNIRILGGDGDRAIGELGGRIRDELEAADGMLAFVDRPNANVTWEIGLGLGRDRPVAMATEGSEAGPWVRETPLVSMLRQGHGANHEVFLDLIDALGQWQQLPRHSQPGGETLILCPTGPTEADGSLCRAVLTRKLGRDSGRLLEVRGWGFTQLVEQLDDIGRVIWVLPAGPHERRRPEHRGDHGAQTAVHALIAGYAVARGLPLAIFRDEGNPVPADVQERVIPYSDIDDLPGLVREWTGRFPPIGRSPQQEDPGLILRLWAGVVMHDHARAVPLLRHAQDAALGAVYVQLALGPGDERHPDDVAPGPLGDLIRRKLIGGGGSAPRLVVWARPGAGKTTLARHLAHELAVPVAEGAAAPIPIFLRLADLPADKHPFQAAEDAFLGVRHARPGSLRRALDAAASVYGRIWLLLDGLDEVQGDDLPSVVCRLAGLADDPSLSKVVIVVLTREVGDDELLRAGAHYQRLKVLPLGEEQQKQLVLNLGHAGLVDRDVVEQVVRSLRQRLIPTDLASNPLLLSLVTLTAAQRVEQSDRSRLHRAAVLSDAIDMLLRRRHRHELAPTGQDTGVRDPDLVRRVLVALALRWQRLGGERWHEDRLVEQLGLALGDLRDGDKNAGATADLLWPDGATDLRAELDRHAGVLGRFDGPRSEWGWLHRSLRERLVAEAMVGMGAKERAALVAQVMAPDEALETLDPWLDDRREGEVARYKPWGEVLGLLAGMVPPAEAMGLLEPLVQAVPAAAVRALVPAEGLAPWVHLTLLQRCVHAGYDPPYPHWDGDDLDAVVEGLRVRGDAVERLWAEVREGIGGSDLGVLWYALSRLGGKVDRERFFRQAGRLASAVPKLDVMRIDGDRLVFDMGGPNGVGYDDERPRHRVTLTRPFALGRTPVTVAQYWAFDPAHACEGEPDCPVSRVTWFAASAYAAWVGGRLPTEAEWECACRAGTTTRWSFGDEEAKLGQHGWFEDNGKNKSQPVGQLKPNRWGLHDMHGNVWEWCECRWFRKYDGPAADPAGPETGGGRVLRGGSAWDDAGRCRSAYRDWYPPGVRSDGFGFRVALP